MSFLSKLQQGAKKAAGQTQTFISDSAALASTQAAAAKTSFSLPGECLKAANILKAFLADPSHPQSALNAIPKAVLLNAKGIAVFQVVKAGFIFSGKGGTGLVVARLPDGEWSAPSLIMTGGLGWGLQVGADITDFVVVLNSDEAVRAFSMGGNVTIGGNVSAAAGPVGTGASVQTALASPAACFSYSKSKGLFAGLSLEGTVLIERKDANAAFYGSKLPAKSLLSGLVPPPEIASPLYEVLEAAEEVDESGVHSSAWVPTADGGHASVHEGLGGAGESGGGGTVFDAGLHEGK